MSLRRTLSIIAAGLLATSVGGVSAAGSPNGDAAGHPETVDRYRSSWQESIGTVPEPPAELRGTYVVSWRQMTSPDKIDRFVQEAADANFNALFVQVRARGDAYYDSELVPRAEDLAGQDPDFDPLAYVIDAAAEHDIDVHAWLNAMVVWGSTSRMPDSPDHIMNAHPDWLMRDELGRVAIPRADDPPNSVVEGPYFLSPGHPEVQEHLYDVYMEVVENYDVDGLHFDFIRFPARMGPDTPAVGYNPVALDRFADEVGAPPTPYTAAWDQWRAEQITTVVSRIKDGLEQRKPDVELSASVLAAWDLGLGRAFQDYRKWMELGLLDFVVPMSYTTSTATVWKDTSDALQVTDPSRVVVGLGAYMDKDNPEMMAEQINLLRSLGVRGFVLFAQDTVGMAPSPRDFMEDLAATTLTRDATVPPLSDRTFNVPAEYSQRDPLTIRVGEIDQRTRSFGHRFFVRNGNTVLRVDNEGLRAAEVTVAPTLADPVTFTLDLQGRREVTVDISEHVDPDTYDSLANHTFRLDVDAIGENGRATFFVEDSYDSP